MGLKLYKVSQDSNNTYDTFDSMVVVAENEDDAKNIMPSRDDSDEPIPFTPSRPVYDSWAVTLESISVEYIGEAREGMKRGVVLASFNAG